MATNTKDNVLVVLQLSGGNDALNTVIPTLTHSTWRTGRWCGLTPRRSCPSMTVSGLTRPWSPSRPMG